MDIIANNNKAKTLKARDQLVQGREVATKLQQLLFHQHVSCPGPADDFMAIIMDTFNNSISDLDSLEPLSSSSLVTAVEGSQNASCDNDAKLEDSGDSRKRLGPVKGKRGCYKRKKRSETWTVERTVLEDAFSWRKYGQKEILNAKFPRSYFRCTHKFTQGCKATKQVQKLELESNMFNITYIGNHTCNTKEVATKVKPCVHHDEIIMDSEELKSPSLATSMKEEEENHHHGSSTESDLQLVWQEILVCEEEHLHHHDEVIYGCGETNVNGLDSTDLWSWQCNE